MLKIGEIRELIRLLDETNLAELKLETEDMKLHLKKPELHPPVLTSAHAPTLVAAPMAAQLPTVPVAQESPNTAAGSHSTSAPVAVPDASVHTITSPMVGTFYRAPSPDAPAYSEVGTHVSQKSIVCIVEAMKLMNEIEAEVSGEVIEILAQNGQLVEYGQPLLKIRLS